jgi:hypothetical protein
MKRLSYNTGERINLFDNYEDTTVVMFNALFYECPLEGHDPDANVVIGQMLSGNRRELLVGDTIVEHKMFSDTLYNMDRDEFNNQDNEVETIMGYPV